MSGGAKYPPLAHVVRKIDKLKLVSTTETNVRFWRKADIELIGFE